MFESSSIHRDSSRSDRKYRYAAGCILAALLPLFMFTYVAVGLNYTQQLQVQLISVVFRHGDRTPSQYYPKDPHQDPRLWPEGVGALTMLGRKQMYKLGETIRRRYDGFLSDNYSPDEIYIFSSDHDRCLMSAQVFLAALYPPVGLQIWHDELHWQPIPVHTIPRKLDQLIVMKKPCPKYESELNATKSSAYLQEVNAKNVDLYAYLTRKSGIEVKSVFGAEFLYDTLDVEHKRGLELPAWTKSVYNDKFKELAAISLASFTHTDVMKRLKAGPLLGDIIEKMNNKVSEPATRKMFIYSGHDMNIVSLMRALNFEELMKPEPGATLIFELRGPDEDNRHFVELLYYNNTEISEPLSLKIPNCGTPCELMTFLLITKDVIPQDWERECQSL